MDFTDIAYLDYLINARCAEKNSSPPLQHKIHMRMCILRNQHIFEGKTTRVIEFIKQMQIWGIVGTEARYRDGYALFWDQHKPNHN